MTITFEPHGSVVFRRVLTMTEATITARVGLKAGGRVVIMLSTFGPGATLRLKATARGGMLGPTTFPRG